RRAPRGQRTILNKRSDHPQAPSRRWDEIVGMRNLLILVLLILALPVCAADRELILAREMLEDAIIRDDAEGIQLARGRLLNIAAEADDRRVLRDAHYLVALSALFESFSAFRDIATSARLVATGIRHVDRAIELDPQF